MGKLLETFDRHVPGLRTFIRGYFPRAEDTEDILQEVFLRAFRQEQRTTIFFYKAFLYKVARNVCINELGKARRKMESSAEDLGGPDVFVDGSHVDGDARLESRRKLALLAEAVETLPPKCRRVFIMRKVDGMRINDIARELGISSSAVEKHVAHGLFLCGEYLRKKGYDARTADARGAAKAAKTVRLGTKENR